MKKEIKKIIKEMAKNKNSVYFSCNGEMLYLNQHNSLNNEYFVLTVNFYFNVLSIQERTGILLDNKKLYVLHNIRYADNLSNKGFCDIKIISL